MCVVQVTVTKNKLYCRQGCLLVQNVDCRLQNALSADRIQNVDCRLQSGYKMQTENEKFFFFVWYVRTCHLTTYWASCNHFSVISFHKYVHYCGIFLVHFLIKIVLNIISSLHIVLSLCVQVGWCDVCTDFTNLIKVDVDVGVNEMSLLNITVISSCLPTGNLLILH